MSAMKKLHCGKCDYPFLMSNAEQTTVTMRYKDLYFWFMGGFLKLICKSCGTMNLVVDTEYEAAHQEFIAAEKAKADVAMAVLKDWVRREDYTPAHAKR